MLAFIGLFLRRALQEDKQQLTKRKASMHWIVSLNGRIGSLPTYFFACMLLLSIQGGILSVHAFTGTYGVNYGRIVDNIPPPESVVTLLKAARVKNIKNFDADHSVLEAFKGSGLNLVVGIGNEYLKDMSVSKGRAMDWIKENVQPFLPDTHIRGITVGNEVLEGADQELQEALLGAI